MTATPLAQGDTAHLVSVDALVVERGRDYYPFPNVEYGYRWGIGHAWDLGFRFNLVGAEFTALRSLYFSDDLRLGIAPGARLGFEPVTNNGTELLTAAVFGRLVGELRFDAASLFVGAQPTVVLAGPVAVFAGRRAGARLRLQLGLTLGLRFVIGQSLSLWPELGVTPTWRTKEGWALPGIHGGLGFGF